MKPFSTQRRLGLYRTRDYCELRMMLYYRRTGEFMASSLFRFRTDSAQKFRGGSVVMDGFAGMVSGHGGNQAFWPHIRPILFDVFQKHLPALRSEAPRPAGRDIGEDRP